ncbi:MAG: hypothetical protein AB7D42_01035 [Candidatus Methanomethylophilaceae archaeon]
MDALIIFAILIILVLIALVVAVLRYEFSNGNQTFKRMIRSGKMSSTGCYYNSENGELELAADFGGATLNMIELTAREAIARKNGGIYLVFISDGQKQRPIRAMISKAPITMEAARAIMDIRHGKGNGVLNVYTYREQSAFALARGNIEIKPVLHRGGHTHKFNHYHRYYKEEEEGEERSPRAFFGEQAESAEDDK